MKALAILLALSIPAVAADKPTQPKPSQTKWIFTLHNSLVKACKGVTGVSLVDPVDKTSWRIDYLDNTTDACKAKAKATIHSFKISVGSK